MPIRTRRALLGGALLLLVGIAAVDAAPAGEKVRVLKAGDPLRKKLLDVLRVPVQKDLKRKVVFQVEQVRVYGEWAFLGGVPRNPNGTPVDYRGTRYWEAKQQGAFDDSIYALWRRRAGRWQVVTYVIGPTDVAWSNWTDQYRAPREVLPFPDN